MGKNKKPFIDRKNKVTFHLVYRSQHDPLVSDETAPQRVLVEASSTQSNKQPLDDINRKKQQRNYGIYFDDEYDYLQHLKKRDQVVWECVESVNPVEEKPVEESRRFNDAKLLLPSSVFPSAYEEEVGLLNKAAPQSGPRPEWDPDIVAALDDDFNCDDEENQLEDDFVLKAMEYDSINEIQEDVDVNGDDIDSSYGDIDENNELVDSLPPLLCEKNYAQEETKSRFTEYSMSSSVIRRNEQLSLLDDRFESFYINYDDPEVGDLATEMIEGGWHQKHPYVMGCYKEFKKSKKILEYNKEWDRKRLEKYKYVDDNDSNRKTVELVIDNPNDNRWDCESILSTYSNTQNYPKIIEEPKKKVPGIIRNNIDQKIKLNSSTSHVRGNCQLSTNILLQLDVPVNKKNISKALSVKSTTSALSVLSIRPNNETPEEKHERKRLLKEYRNERRIEKKANALAFKEEKKRQLKVKLNQQQNQGTRVL